MTETDSDEVREFEVLPADRMRRGTARRMLASVNEKPHVTLHAEARVEALLALWREMRSELPKERHRELTLTAVIAFVVAASLVRDRRLNGRVEEGETRLYRAVNLGVAVDAGGGLVVPVLRDAAASSIFEIGSELCEFADKARERRLSPEDLQDATFTVTNLGMFGVHHFTPIINPPQFAILGVGSTVSRLELLGGEPVSTESIGLSLSFDHAVMDGADAARFVQLLIMHLEHPETLISVGDPPLPAASRQTETMNDRN